MRPCRSNLWMRQCFNLRKKSIQDHCQARPSNHSKSSVWIDFCFLFERFVQQIFFVLSTRLFYLRDFESNSFPHTLLSQTIVIGFRVSGVYYFKMFLSGSITPYTRLVDLTETLQRVSNQSKTHFVCPWQVFFSGHQAFTCGGCINLTWCTILLIFVLKTLTTNLLNDRDVFSGGWHVCCIMFILGLNCDRASPVAWWTLGALPRSKKLFASIGCALPPWACHSMHRQAFLGRVRQDYDFWWSIVQPLLLQSKTHGRPCPGRWSCASCCFQETSIPCPLETGNALRSQAWTAWVAGGRWS